MDASVWTPEARTKVAELLRHGDSAGQIARQFHATRNAIIGLVHRDKMLTAVGFARSPSGKAKPSKKVIMHKPENHFAVLVKPRLVKAGPKPRARKPTCGKPVAAAPMHIPMLAIAAGQCRYPMWQDHGGPDFLMCGAATGIEQSYCAGHKATVYEARER